MKLQNSCSSNVYCTCIYKLLHIYMYILWRISTLLYKCSGFLSYCSGSNKNLVCYDTMSTVHRGPCDTVRLLALSLGHTNVRNGHTCRTTLTFTASQINRCRGTLLTGNLLTNPKAATTYFLSFCLQYKCSDSYIVQYGHTCTWL